MPIETLPTIGAVVNYSGALGRIERLTPASLPMYPVVRIGCDSKTLRLCCLVEKYGVWVHQRQEKRQAEYKRAAKALRWKSEPAVEEPPASMLLSEHWDRVYSFGHTREQCQDARRMAGLLKLEATHAN